MGIHNLSKLLEASAPSCIRQTRFEDYFGRRVAVDASMHIYQFLVAVGRTGELTLTDASGEETSHLQGMFYRTVRMLEAGIKPIYVFDGKPPEGKAEELEKRLERRADAERALKKAVEEGDAEAVEKFSKRTVRMTQRQIEECQRLLLNWGFYMGFTQRYIPWSCSWTFAKPRADHYERAGELVRSV